MKTDLCVLGLGYIGLPTAALFADAGLRVVGVDVNERIVEAVNAGKAPFAEPGLPEIIARIVASSHLGAKTQPVAADAFLIAVGTPLGADNRPDLDYVRSAATNVGRLLKKGNLVVLESTVPPGTTQGLVREILEAESGLRAGVDFHLAQCPERAIPGTALREMRENDRLVGGTTPEAAEAASALYRRVVRGRIFATDSLTSEIVKLAENTYRDVNIALANELSDLCERLGADVWRVIEFANKHPRVHLHQPGPGVGGHCIPVAPWFLLAARPEEMPMLRLSRRINDDRAEVTIQRSLDLVASASGKARIVVAGVAYKAGVDDARESPALPVIEGLEGAGCAVVATDPHVTRYPHAIVPIEAALEGADLLVVMTQSAEYAALDPEVAAKRMRGRVVYDTRNVLPVDKWRAAGFKVARLGGR